MNNRIQMMSNRVDKHGDMMTDGALEGAAQQINGELKLPWILNHRRDLPPLGRIVNAAVENKGNHLVLTAETAQFDKREDVPWDSSLIVESFDTKAPFVAREKESCDYIQVSLDRNNFTSLETFENINRQIFLLDKKADLAIHARKADIPDPELILFLGKLTILYKFLKPFTDKILEKAGEDFYVEAKKQLKNFSNYVVKVFKMTRQNTLPRHRTMITVFEIQGPPLIELLAKTDDAGLLSKALDEKRLSPVKEEIEKFMQHFDVAVIQFTLTDKGRWKFNYLLTKNGEAVGKKSSFKERDKQFQRVSLNHPQGATYKPSVQAKVKRTILPPKKDDNAA